MPMPMVDIPLQPDPAVVAAAAKAAAETAKAAAETAKAEAAAAKAKEKEAAAAAKESKERMNKMGRAASGVSKLIIPIGIIALSYYVLKTWKVIGTAGLDDLSWEALPDGELESESLLLDSIQPYW